MIPVQSDTRTLVTIGEPVNAREIEALQSLVDAFVATTLETISTADATVPDLRDDPAHRAKVDEILGYLGELEALVAIVRGLNEN